MKQTLGTVDAVDPFVDRSYTRRRFLRTAAGVSIGAAGLDLAGLRLGAAHAALGNGSKTIAVDLPFVQADVYPPLIAGAKQEAAKRGYKILESSSQLDLSHELNELNTWIPENIAAITAYPLDLKSFGPVVKKAHQHNEVFVAYGSPVPGADGSTLFNDPQAAVLIGTAAAAWAHKKLGGKANVALLTQNELQTNKARIDATIKQMQKLAPGAKVIAQAEAAAAPDALKATQSLLSAHPEINMMICINDQDLIGVGQALKQARRAASSVWAGGFDGSKAAMEAILAGTVVGATAALPLKQIGATTVSVPAAILAGKKGKADRNVVTDYVLVSNSTPALTKKLIADYSG
jgi:ABC-type sugar transport system substrate-binding protein